MRIYDLAASYLGGGFEECRVVLKNFITGWGDESVLKLDCGDLLYNCVSLLEIVSLSLQ